ncbi:MAG: amidohydrolase family protein [Alphaproteobacteria bacterium]|nr:amidohydrolase family protein [Alphaproteobacteria bacterium]
MPTTVIRNCAWIVAYDPSRKSQAYLRDADVAFRDDRIIHVGRGYAGATDTTISGKHLMVMPGLVDLHAHPSLEPHYRGIREEHGVREMGMAGLYERSVVFWPDKEGQLAAAEAAYSDLLLSGVTTLADLSGAYEGWVELMAKSGLRSYIAPGFASSRWHLDNRHELKFKWDVEAGKRHFERALKMIDEIGKHPSGRLTGMIFPAQIETCTPELLRDAVSEGRRRKLPISTHASQAVAEFHEITRRHGATPVQFAQSIGLLGPDITLAHCIFIDDHPWVHWRPSRDVAILADTGTTVAHCPTPFARYGAALQDFGRYFRAGVNMGVGTDTVPHNMIEEMRLAVILGKVMAGDVHGTVLDQVFHAATLGGARALLREDIGKLAVGAKADLVLVDLEEPTMIPARDPLRGMVFHAAERAVRDVYVDGRQVVKDRKVLTLDRAGALERLKDAQVRMMREAPSRDWLKRTADEVAPLTLPTL